MNYFKYFGHYARADLAQHRTTVEYTMIPAEETNMVELQDMTGKYKKFSQKIEKSTDRDKQKDTVEVGQKMEENYCNSDDEDEIIYEEKIINEVIEGTCLNQDVDQQVDEALEQEVQNYNDNFDSEDLNLEIIESEDKSQLISEILELRETIEALKKRLVNSSVYIS